MTEEGERWTVVMTVPMRWSHSVAITLAIHEEVLRSCSIDKSLSVREGLVVVEYRYGT